MSSFTLNHESVLDLLQENWLGPLLFLGNYIYCERTDSDVGYLLFGGMLLGDTFHTIPLLNWLTGERRRSKIIWWSGTYEKAAVEFLKNFYPIEAEYCPDGVPTERKDRLIFLNDYLPLLGKALEEGAWQEVKFDSKANKEFELKNIERLKATPGNFIVIHPASRHSWKNIDAINNTDWSQFGLPIITVGGAGELLIPGSYDLRGRPFFEVARALASARLIVGIHSAISCLSLYLNRPMVVCAPHTDAAYVRFGELKSGIIDLIQPTEKELIETVNQCLRNSSDDLVWAGDLTGDRERQTSPLEVLKGIPIAYPQTKQIIFDNLIKAGSHIHNLYRRARCALGLRTRWQRLLGNIKKIL